MARVGRPRRKFYLYGGYGFDEKSSQRGYLNDVWKYDITLNQWVWLSGDKIINSTNSKDYPIAKEESGMGWQDENKNFGIIFLVLCGNIKPIIIHGRK